jgi:hypothetical protein
VLHRGTGDHVDRQRADGRRVLGPVAVGVERRGRHDQPAEQLRLLDGEVQRHRTADAEPEHIDLRHTQVLEHPRHVGCQGGAGQRSVEVACPAVCLEVQGDHPTRARQGRQDRTELQVDVEQPAVQQQQRRPA